MATGRQVHVTSPLGEDVLLFQRMTAKEEMGRLFRFDLELLSEDDAIKIPDILGQNMTVHLDLPDDKTRYFNGFVSRFSFVGHRGNLALYTATLRPWLWFLTRIGDCRIFQEMMVPEIIKEIFDEHPYSDYEDKSPGLSGSYRKRNYCTQYRETDFNFVSRLMEEEGIYYYFKHDDGKHTLVLSDGTGAHELIPDYKEVPFYPPAKDTNKQDVLRKEDHVFDWVLSQKVQTEKYATTDYDYENPPNPLATDASISRDDKAADGELFEYYEYPGKYIEKSHGDAYAMVRIEARHAHYERVRGRGNARGFMSGGLFKLVNHRRDDQNREYLIVAATHRLEVGEYESTDAPQTAPTYRCEFEAIDSRKAFRSESITPKSVVQGPHTAVVVGPSGETKTWTDKYGRVKVQFHWDRVGKKDENSSCWVRVSQNWAGKGWGGMFIPHVGHEVLVDFLEGDPDKPIITGRVYNNDNMPHLALPDNQTKSIIRDHYGNELIFDATPDDEHIRIHSPHHRSSLEVGRSYSYKSASDRKGLTIGNSSEFNIGYYAKGQIGLYASAFLGGKADFFLGVSTSLWLGASMDFIAGFKGSWAAGGKYEYTRGYKIVDNTSKTIEKNLESRSLRSDKNVTIDAEDEARLVGGGSDNSIIKAGPQAILISYGKNNTPNDDSAEKAMRKLAVKSNRAKVLGALGLATTTVVGTAAICEQAGIDMDNAQAGHVMPDVNTGYLWAGTGISAVGTMVALGLGHRYAKKLMNFDAGKNPDSEQDNTFSEIELSKKGVTLKGNDDSSKTKSLISVFRSGVVKVESPEGKDIHLKTKGKIILEAAGGVIIKKNKIKNQKGTFDVK